MVHLFLVSMTYRINFSLQIFKIKISFWMNILQCSLNVLVFAEDCSAGIFRLGLEQINIMVLIVVMFF